MPKKVEPTGFAHRLRELREAAGLTQDQLAERAGLYKFSVAKLEQGVREPTWATVLTLAKALGVDCLSFIGPEDGKVGPAPRGRPAKAPPSTPPGAELEAKGPARRGRKGK
jgi:transcriptional regulator with XRE-family HTH domain